MRTVEVKVWTNSLGHLEVTPLLDDEETVQILREADGCYDDVVEAIEEATDSFLSTYDFYVTDVRADNCITVVDNGEETVYENAISDRCIDDSFLYEYINSDIDFENPTDEMKEEYYYKTGIEISDCLRIVNAEVVGDDGQLPTLFFERLKNKDEIIKNEGLIISHIHSMLERFYFNVNEQRCLFNYDDIRTDSLRFYINLEDDEEFDINKLHFLYEPWWWDCYVCETAPTLPDILEYHDVLLDFVEYNGKIYRYDPDYAPYGQSYECHEPRILMHPDMSAAELD